MTQFVQNREIYEQVVREAAPSASIRSWGRRNSQQPCQSAAFRPPRRTELWYTIDHCTMSQTSFKTFCIELYARHANVTGAEAYRRFAESGLLKILDEDYEDLHGMGWEALMPMFDQYLEGTAK